MTLQEIRKELEKKLEYAQNSHAAFAKGVGSEGGLSRERTEGSRYL